MAAIWAQMLGVKRVGPDDNFFALGGHSLLGVKLIAAVQEKLNLGDELKLSDLFEFPTLEAFSAHIEIADSAQRGVGQRSSARANRPRSTPRLPAHGEKAPQFTGLRPRQKAPYRTTRHR